MFFKILLLTFSIFTFQRFINDNFVTSCENPQIAVGTVHQNNTCYLSPLERQISYEKMVHYGSMFVTTTGCKDNTCKECNLEETVDYGCRKVQFLFFDSFYGLPKPVEKTGFYFQFYSNMDLCLKNVTTPTLYYITGQCLDDSSKFLKNENGKSTKLEWDDQRGKLLIEVFNQKGCHDGLIFRDYFSSGTCIRIPHQNGIVFKVRKTF